MQPIAALIDGYCDGSVSKDELRSWVLENTSRYKKPNISELAGATSKGKKDAILERICDWDDRSRGTQHELNRWMSIVKREEDALRGHRILEAVFEVSHVFGSLTSVAGPAFGLGYYLWSGKRYHEAAEFLETAFRGFASNAECAEEALHALSYFSDCLVQDKQHDKGLTVAEQLIDLAQSQSKRGVLACALRDKGQHLFALGRPKAVETLEAALELRKKLPPVEESEEGVPTLEAFMDQLAVVFRAHGFSDKAMLLYLALAEMCEKKGDYRLQALAVSDIGYAYLQAGSVERCIGCLEKAIEISLLHNVNQDNTVRWRIQVANFRHEGTACSAADSDPESDEEAALLAEKANGHLVSGQYQEARLCAEKSLNWALQNRNVDMQILCLNVIGASSSHLGNVEESVRSFQKAVQLSDFHGRADQSASIRSNLAGVLIDKGRLQQAVHVLLAGIAANRLALSKTQSTALRQEVIAGHIRSYELLALVLGNTGNYEALVRYTDDSRALNLSSWFLAADILSGTSRAVPDSISSDLRALRSCAVETEIRHLRGLTDPHCMQRLADEREGAITRITEYCGLSGTQQPDWQLTTPDGSGRIAEVLALLRATDAAAMYFYSTDEGICISVCSPRSGGGAWKGACVPWDRKDRLSAFAEISSLLDMQRSKPWLFPGRASRSDAQRQRSHEANPLAALVDKLFRPLADLVRQFPERNFILFPHAELAAVPYWQLFELLGENVNYCICPSLSVFRICSERHRSGSAPVLTMDDSTKTLRYSRKELQDIRQWKECLEAQNMHQLQQLGGTCGTIHIAAHGLYNPNNPYYSGIVMVDDASQTDDVLSQFVSIEGFSDVPKSGSYRLATCAELMAKFDFSSCRLAVLSACESGVTRIHGAGEMTGLPTAFLVAGAKTVVASLWPVNDGATALLMHYFWDAWRGSDDHSPTAALTAARGRLLRANRSEVIRVLGSDEGVPDADFPYDAPVFSDAFQCYGAF